MDQPRGLCNYYIWSGRIRSANVGAIKACQTIDDETAIRIVFLFENRRHIDPRGDGKKRPFIFNTMFHLWKTGVKLLAFNVTQKKPPYLKYPNWEELQRVI